MSTVNINPFTTTIPKLESVTEKYRFISTAEFIKDVQSLGYKLEYTRQPRRGLGMHYMSFSHPDMPKVEGLDLRVGFSNSHDGSHAFRGHIETGVGICTNVLLAYIPDLAYAARIVHVGYAVSKVAAAIDAVRGRINHVIDSVQELQSVNVTPEVAAEFIVKASELRDAKPYRLAELNTCRHRGQDTASAWDTFNRVQESLIKGGYQTKDVVTLPSGIETVVPGRRAKELTSVRERVQTNYKLWQLAVETLLKA